MNKKILVKTDDPEKKQFYLTITGRVKRIVEIKPSVVSLSGAPGESLEAMVSIIPAENYEMNITKMNQKFNTNIKAELLAPEQGKKEWQIRIKSFSDKADDFYDIITLKTDNPLKPLLKVRVYAIYLDKNVKKS